MVKNTIDPQQFQEWACDTVIEYAAETVKNGKYLHRLRFLLKASGGYKVTLKEKVLYEGGNFSDAVDAYHSAA